MNRNHLEEAALNNALWCDAVCRAHGRPGEILPALWINRRETPRFYPNLVTLSPTERRLQLDTIAALVDSGLPGEWGVKDSFAALDLVPLGFRVLFEAEWIRRPPAAMSPFDDSGLQWRRAGEADELRAWEAAWGGDSSDVVFRSALLADANIAVIAGCRGGRVVAGVIANRTGDVVGVSNFFALEEDATAACVSAALAIFPGLALVGYEPAPRLEALRQLGFEAIGPLRVWVRDVSAV